MATKKIRLKPVPKNASEKRYTVRWGKDNRLYTFEQANQVNTKHDPELETSPEIKDPKLVEYLLAKDCFEEVKPAKKAEK